MAITLSNISKTFGSRILFDGVTLTFNDGERYGLTGPNGAGKSTLLKIVMGMEEATTGTVSLPPKVGMLRQNIEDFKDIKVLDAVIMGNERLWSALQEQDELYAQEMTDAIGMRLGELMEIVAEEDGYSAESNAEILLLGSHVPKEYHDQAMSAIPTGMQFRVLLCQALFGEPDALLLDEPTNHLDLESIGWLEEFLGTYTGTVVVVSHDRHFLNAICTQIADIDYESVIVYPGNYDAMITTKSSVRSRAEADARSREKKISQLKEFVQRFGAGSRASQVQSRIREMKRLEPSELKKSNIQRPYIKLKMNEKPPGRVMVTAEDLCKAYDGQAVIENFSLEIHRGDKIGIIGNNGRGKTTLLRMLAGQIEPDQGKVSAGHGVALAYFPQVHTEVVDKTTDDNMFDWLKARRGGVYDQDIRSVLGRLLFGGDDAFKKVATLSGGETARLILAGMMLQNHNMIILDEPNNHLDLESVSALAWGLEQYDGTVVVASHDRDLIGSVANKIVSFEEDGIYVYEGTLEEYLAKRMSNA